MTPANILVAYPYCTPPVLRALDIAAQRGARILIDSGGFTAHNSGKPISRDRYAEFLRALSVPIVGAFTLDVIGNPTATRENLNFLRDAGLNPWPIAPYGTPRAEIAAYAKESPRIGLGGLVASSAGRQRKDLKSYLAWVYKEVDPRTTHVLGVASPALAQVWGPASMDSAYWVSCKRFGAMRLYIGHGETVSIKRSEFKRHVISERDRLALASYGVLPHTFTSDAFWRGNPEPYMQVAARSQRRLMADCETMYGTHLFAACGNAAAILALVDGDAT